MGGQDWACQSTEMTTRTQITDLRHQHPDWTLAHIGHEVGTSKQYVQQVLQDARLPTTIRPYRRARSCQKCGRKIRWFPPRTVSWELSLCWYCRTHTILTCEICGISFPITMRDVRHRVKAGYTHTFCSRRCRGRYTGRLYGRLNLLLGSPRKYNYDNVLSLQAQGHTWTDIARMQNIPRLALSSHVYRLRRLFAY